MASGFHTPPQRYSRIRDDEGRGVYSDPIPSRPKAHLGFSPHVVSRSAIASSPDGRIGRFAQARRLRAERFEMSRLNGQNSSPPQAYPSVRRHQRHRGNDSVVVVDDDDDGGGGGEEEEEEIEQLLSSTVVRESLQGGVDEEWSDLNMALRFADHLVRDDERREFFKAYFQYYGRPSTARSGSGGLDGSMQRTQNFRQEVQSSMLFGQYANEENGADAISEISEEVDDFAKVQMQNHAQVEQDANTVLENDRDEAAELFEHALAEQAHRHPGHSVDHLSERQDERHLLLQTIEKWTAESQDMQELQFLRSVVLRLSVHGRLFKNSSIRNQFLQLIDGFFEQVRRTVHNRSYDYAESLASDVSSVSSVSVAEDDGVASDLDNQDLDRALREEIAKQMEAIALGEPAGRSEERVRSEQFSASHGLALHDRVTVAYDNYLKELRSHHHEFTTGTEDPRRSPKPAGPVDVHDMVSDSDTTGATSSDDDDREIEAAYQWATGQSIRSQSQPESPTVPRGPPQKNAIDVEFDDIFYADEILKS
eukprot:ANDGO_04297.mRNA.1 hypothetical protein